MIKQFFILNKKPILIFIIVFAAELTAIFALSNINGIETFLRGDGRDYENLADNLINHKILAITPGPPYTPTSFRTPGYNSRTAVYADKFPNPDLSLLACLNLFDF